MDNRKSIVDRFSGKCALVLDDHKLFADSFVKFLKSLNIFTKVHVFYEENEIFRFLLRHRENMRLYFFLDYYLTDNTILKLLTDIGRFSKYGKIIIVSTITNPVLIKNLINYKPDGLVSKSSSASEITECICQVEAGSSFICPEIRSFLNQAVQEQELLLTPREIEIVKYFAKGMSAGQIAQELQLSPHTIFAHRKKMFRKTETNNITELLAFARNIAII